MFFNSEMRFRGGLDSRKERMSTLFPGERRLPACSVRQLAGRLRIRLHKKIRGTRRFGPLFVRGNLPRTAGWQRALPDKNLAPSEPLAIIPTRAKCGCSSVVEHLLAKEDVASSSLVTRSLP